MTSINPALDVKPNSALAMPSGRIGRMSALRPVG